MKFQRKPHYTRQPAYSALCGQTCLSILSGQSVQAICDITGCGSTRYQDLRKGLGSLGFRVGPLQRGAPGPEVAYALCRLGYWQANRRRYHWLLSWEGVLLDPAGPRNHLCTYYNKRILSHLCIDATSMGFNS